MSLGMDDIKEAWRVKLQQEDENRHIAYHGDDGDDPGPHIWCVLCFDRQGED